MSEKLEDQELKKLQELNNKIGACLHDVGVLEVQKSQVFALHGETIKQLNVFKDELNIKYGKINVDIATGKITEIKEDGEKEGS